MPDPISENSESQAWTIKMTDSTQADLNKRELIYFMVKGRGLF
jgi:hypothetical protein